MFYIPIVSIKHLDYLQITLIGLCVPFIIIFYPNNHKGFNICFQRYEFISLSTPFIIVTAITVERYFAINRCDFHKEHCTPVKKGFIVLFIWLFLLKWVVKGNKWNAFLCQDHLLYSCMCTISHHISPDPEGLQM